jgi:hypothetical protein
MHKPVRKPQDNLLADPIANREKILQAMGHAIHDAVCEHKHAGRAAPVWQDGKVVWIAPEDIVLPPDPDEET